MDTWIDGEAAGDGTACRGWHDLGRLLATLYGLTVVGHGRLAVVAGGLAGRMSGAEAGVSDRFQAPWPRAAEHLRRSAGLLALVVALHHLGRTRTLGLPARRDFALARLLQGLDAAAAG